MSDLHKAKTAETPDEDPRTDVEKNKVTVTDTESDRRVTLESSEDTVAELEFAGKHALEELGGHR